MPPRARKSKAPATRADRLTAALNREKAAIDKQLTSLTAQGAALEKQAEALRERLAHIDALMSGERAAAPAPVRAPVRAPRKIARKVSRKVSRTRTRKATTAETTSTSADASPDSAPRNGRRSRGPTVADRVVALLEEHGGPLHYREIATKLAESGGVLPKGKDPAANLLAQYFKDERVYRPDRGTYALREGRKVASVGTRRPGSRRKKKS